MPLIELGAVELIEMGNAYLGQAQIQSPVLDLFSVVNYLEDPYKGVEIEPGESISSKQRAIAERLRTISRLERRALVKDVSLSGFSLSELMSERMRLAAILNQMGDEAIALGKFKLGKKLKKVGGKVMKVVKSPAFLSVVGIAANLIPGVGQAVSLALTATAGIMAKKQQEAKQKKEFKKAEGQQAAAEQQAMKQQLDAYYAQYQANFEPLGYTPAVWSKLTVKEKTAAAQKLSEGRLEPYASASGQTDEAAKAAALSIAMKKEYGAEAPGEGVDVDSLPPEVQHKAKALAPQYEKQIKAAGKDNFLAAAKKAVGQGSAISSFFSGAGAELPGGLSDIFSKAAGDDATKAGIADLENTGAAVGAGGAVSGLIDAGTPSSFPIVPVGIAAGSLVVLGGLYVILR